MTMKKKQDSALTPSELANNPNIVRVKEELEIMKEIIRQMIIENSFKKEVYSAMIETIKQVVEFAHKEHAHTRVGIEIIHLKDDYTVETDLLIANMSILKPSEVDAFFLYDVDLKGDNPLSEDMFLKKFDGRTAWIESARVVA